MKLQRTMRSEASLGDQDAITQDNVAIEAQIMQLLWPSKDTLPPRTTESPRSVEPLQEQAPDPQCCGIFRSKGGGK